MAKTTEKITAKKLQQITRAISSGQALGDMFDTEVSGFHVRPGKRNISYRIKYLAPGTNNQRVYTLGRYPDLTAEQARELARDLLGRVARGVDIQETKQSAKKESDLQKQQTLSVYLAGPYAVYQSRHKKGRETLAMIRNHYPDLLPKPMSQITTRDIDRWQIQKEVEGLAWATIRRVYGALTTLLNHAVKKGFIDANPLRGHQLEKPALTEQELSAAQSRRYLEAHEVKALFAALDAYQDEKRQHEMVHQRDSDQNARNHGPLKQKRYVPRMGGAGSQKFQADDAQCSHQPGRLHEHEIVYQQ